MKADYKPFPKPISIGRMLGPSFIILALGLGSGEVILWPYLSANFGLGIAWGALLGITFQFFMNMEIERYALIKGESVFVGLTKRYRYAAHWFIMSTFLGFGLPGIIAASAQVFSSVFNITQFKWVAIAALIIIGLILSTGKTVYGMMEKITKTIIFLGVPFIIALVAILTSSDAWISLGKGLLGVGPNYFLLPKGISLAAFLAAFAYSGAGGNLNLTQSIYIKEKGYGMGMYSKKIAGVFRQTRGDSQVQLSGKPFIVNAENIARFRSWWRRTNTEHFIVFWLIGLFTICLLMTLAYSTTYGLPSNPQGIMFVISEGAMIGDKIAPIVGALFLLVVSGMLFQTQLGVMDSTSRIMAENVVLERLRHAAQAPGNPPRVYSAFA